MEPLVFRGIARHLIESYLQELGGTLDEVRGRLAGHDWEATVVSLPAERIGSLELPVVRVELAGESKAVAALVSRLRRKTFRGGG